MCLVPAIGITTRRVSEVISQFSLPFLSPVSGTAKSVEKELAKAVFKWLLHKGILSD